MRSSSDRVPGLPLASPSSPLFALLVLCGITAVCFHETVFGGRVFFERDVHLVWYTYLSAIRRCLDAHSLPLWNNFISFGEPLWANPSVQILYPFTWLALATTPAFAYIALVVVHVAFSGFGLFLLARRLLLSPVASLVAASVWILSGPLVSMVTLWHHLAGVAWLPWVLVAVDRLAEGPTLRRFLCVAAVAGAQALAGSADACAMTGLLATGYLLSRLGRTSLVPLLWMAAAWTLALCLAGAQWLPALELATRTGRWDLGNATRTYWSVHPAMLLQLVLPFRWDALRPNTRGILLEGREPLLASLYLGMPALGLAVASWARRGRAQIYFTMVAIVSLAVATGKFGPFHHVALMLLPPLRVLRYPVKVLASTAFAVAILAGVGLDGLLESATARKRLASLLSLASPALVASFIWACHPRWAAFVFGEGGLFSDRISVSLTLALLAALVAAVGLPRAPRFTGGTLGALAALDLLLVHGTLNPTARPEFFRYRPPVLTALAGRGDLRVHVREYILLAGQPPPQALSRYRLEFSGLGNETVAVLKALSSVPGLFPPSAGRFGVETSYDTDMLGLYPPFLSDLVAEARRSDGSPSFLRFLQLGAVGSVIAVQPLKTPGLLEVASYPGLAAEPIHLYSVPTPNARCYVVGSSVVADQDAALKTLADATFDPASTVVLPTGDPLQGGAGFLGSCAIDSLVPDRVRLTATATASAFVVLVDTFDPGWRATLDGVSAPLLRANVAFRAVAIPKGTHSVEMAFRPPFVGIGLGLSAASLVALGFGFVWTRRRP